MAETDRAVRLHLVRQTAISVVVNGVLSLAFGSATAFGRASVPLGGAGGMAFDFFPQTFMITLATVTAVTLATRRQVRLVSIPAHRRTLWPRPALARAFAAAVVVTLVLAPLAGLTLAVLRLDVLDSSRFLLSKLAYGVLLSVLIAPMAALLGRDP